MTVERSCRWFSLLFMARKNTVGGQTESGLSTLKIGTELAYKSTRQNKAEQDNQEDVSQIPTGAEPKVVVVVVVVVVVYDNDDDDDDDTGVV